MSESNAKPSKAARGEWRILNQTDKLYSEVAIRQMTEEERQKYGLANPSTKIKLGVDEYMEKLNITTEQLIEDCKVHGTSWAAAKIIGDKHKLTQKQVYNLIGHRKIKDKLDTETKKPNKKEKCTKHKDCEVTEHKGYKEHSLGLPEGVTPVTYEVETDNKGIAINFAELKEYKPRLRPTGLISQNINGLVYKLFSESLVITILNGTAEIGIDYQEIDELIKDLQEIKEIAEV